MPNRPAGVLPRRFPQRPAPAIRVSPLLVEAATRDAPEVLRQIQTSLEGLSEEEAERRLQRYGTNTVAQEVGYRRLRLLGTALINPLVILLLVLATLSYLTDDIRG